MLNPVATSPEPPVFTVLMAAYQAEATIARAVGSVLAQTRRDWELVIVDDGSTDSTFARAVEATRGDPRVVVLQQTNSGPAAARNRAARQARGRLLCVLDADDEFAPSYFDVMGGLADAAPEVGLFSCNAVCVDPSGARTPWLDSAAYDRPAAFTLRQLLRRNDVFVMATVRADAFRAVGGFAEDLARAEDYDLWLRLLASGSGHRYTPECLGVYHRSSASLSADTEVEVRAISLLMRRLLENASLTRPERREARARIRAATARAELERRRREGDFSISRREALGTVWAFGAPSRRLVARLMAVANPSWYLSVATRRREEQVAALYDDRDANRRDP